MGERLAGILELPVTTAAVTAYGPPARPRPRFLRAAVRGVAFGGPIAALLAMTGETEISIPIFVIAVWVLCGMSVLLAEHELGRGWIALAAWGLATALLVSVLWVA